MDDTIYLGKEAIICKNLFSHPSPVNGPVLRQHILSQQLHQPFIAGLSGQLDFVSHLIRKQDAAAAAGSQTGKHL